MKRIITLTALFIILSLLTRVSAQETPSAKEMNDWFKKKEWLGGLKLIPHKTINKQEFYRQYHANKAYWDKAFAFLKEQNLKSMAKGKYPVDGENVFATVTESPSKSFDSTRWESHRQYIDLQYVIDGRELIGVHPVSQSTVTIPYDEKKDLANYTANGKLYPATPATFFIFFPSDAHRPNIEPGGNKVVKKIVIKVRSM